MAKPAIERREPPRRARRRVRVRDDYDIVPDYGEVIRRAREAKGWTQAALAQKLRVSESIVRKLEAGKMKPSIDLAKRLERVLRIKLLEPVIEEEYVGEDEEEVVTLGDVVVVRDEE